MIIMLIMWEIGKIPNLKFIHNKYINKEREYTRQYKKNISYIHLDITKKTPEYVRYVQRLNESGAKK